MWLVLNYDFDGGYTVDGAFTTYEKARAHFDTKKNQRRLDIEEFILDEPAKPDPDAERPTDDRAVDPLLSQFAEDYMKEHG